MDAFSGFSASQLRTLRALDSPAKVAKFVGGLQYNAERDGETAHSPRLVLEKRSAHCLEGAVFAACSLRMHGYVPMLVDLRATRDEDHVLCVFKQDGRWGSIAKSKFTGLRGRDPVYLSVRELAASYFEHYFNLAGEKSLREYSRPLDLRKFDERNWMASGEQLWFLERELDAVPHSPIMSKAHARNLTRVRGSLFQAGCLGHPKLKDNGVKH